MESLVPTAFSNVLRWLFHRPKDLPPCNTRIIRRGRGFFWDKQIAIHSLKDGRVEMYPIP